MTLNLVKPESVVSSAYARWLIYGPNGAGKSTLAATIPRPMMVISALGENMAPYAPANIVKVNGVEMPDVVINEVGDWDQIHETFMMLRTGKTPFKSVVFDTLTRIMGFYLNKLAGVSLSGDQVISYLKSSPTRKAANFDTWRDLGEQSVRTVMLYNQLPMHTLYLAQEDTKQVGHEVDVIETAPVLSPASWKGVKDIVHLVGRLYVAEDNAGSMLVPTDNVRAINPNRKDKRMLLVGQHDRFFSKGDSQTLGYCVENPCWDNLSKVLK